MNFNLATFSLSPLSLFVLSRSYSHYCLLILITTTLLSTVSAEGVRFVNNDHRVKPRERDGSHPKTPKELNSVVLNYQTPLKPEEPSIPDVNPLLDLDNNRNNNRPPSPTSIFYFWFLFISFCAITGIILILIGINFVIKVGRLLLRKLGIYENNPEDSDLRDVGSSSKGPGTRYYDPETPREQYTAYYGRKPYKMEGNPPPPSKGPGIRRESSHRESFHKSRESGRRNSFKAQTQPPPKSPISLQNSENLSYAECLQILEVVENGAGLLSRGEINRSFRKKSLVIHPDKHVNLEPSLLEEKTQQFRLLCHARDKLLTMAQD